MLEVYGLKNWQITLRGRLGQTLPAAHSYGSQPTGRPFVHADSHVQANIGVNAERPC